jgi:hypothetical protein
MVTLTLSMIGLKCKFGTLSKKIVIWIRVTCQATHVENMPQKRLLTHVDVEVGSTHRSNLRDGLMDIRTLKETTVLNISF